MKNKKRIVITTLLIAYALIIIVFAISIFRLSGTYVRMEKAYIEEVQLELGAVFSAAKNQDELKKELTSITEQFPMELIVYKGQQRVFETIPLERNQVRDSINTEMTLLQTQGTFSSGGQEYQVWYNLYHLQSQDYLTDLTRMQFVLIGVSILILATLSLMMQYMLFKPLSKIKDNLDKIEKYELTSIIEDENLNEDEINKKLRKFASHLDSNIKSISRNYTGLEQALQVERERLSNTITVAKAFIHDLKSPIHQAMLENEVVLKKLEGKSELATEILKHNIERNEDTIHTINDILVLMNENIFDLDKVKEKTDLVKLIGEAKKLFLPIIQKKNIFISVEVPDSLEIAINVPTFKLLLHNVLSNATQYAIEGSEIIVGLEVIDNEIVLTCENESLLNNITRMKQSGKLFNNLVDEEHQYSSGNGLFLIQELAIALEGKYEIVTSDNTVIVCIILANASM